LKSLSEFTPDKFGMPNFTVLKDMFDAIDIDKDGLLSNKEWNTIFLKMGLQKNDLNKLISFYN
jgi:hypothetical protein